MSQNYQYKKGDLKLVRVPTEEEYNSPDFDFCEPYLHPRHGSGMKAFLPHSCDEWIIGGEDEIGALIEDLNLALKSLRAVR